jgi:hypothetical protein
MRDARRSSTRAVSAFVLCVVALGASFAACTTYKRSNGEDCLKDEDCLSQVCRAGVCAAPPPILNGPSYPLPEGGGVDAGVDTGTPETPDSAAPEDSGGADSPVGLFDAHDVRLAPSCDERLA